MVDRLEQAALALLRAKVQEVATAQEEIQALEKQMQHIRIGLEARRGGLAVAVGGRDALAALLLPEGMTLAQAMKDDYKGIRTGQGEETNDRAERSDE